MPIPPTPAPWRFHQTEVLLPQVPILPLYSRRRRILSDTRFPSAVSEESPPAVFLPCGNCCLRSHDRQRQDSPLSCHSPELRDRNASPSGRLPGKRPDFPIQRCDQTGNCCQNCKSCACESSTLSPQPAFSFLLSFSFLPSFPPGAPRSAVSTPEKNLKHKSRKHRQHSDSDSEQRSPCQDRHRHKIRKPVLFPYHFHLEEKDDKNAGKKQRRKRHILFSPGGGIRQTSEKRLYLAAEFTPPDNGCQKADQKTAGFSV